MKRVVYEYGGYGLQVADGVMFRFDDVGDGFLAAVSDARDISLTALRDALSRVAKEYELTRPYLRVVDVPPDELSDGLLVNPTDIVWEAGELRVSREIGFADPPPSETEILARTHALAHSQGAGAISSSQERHRDYWLVTVEIPVRTRGRTIQAALAIAEKAEMLVATPVDHLDLATAAGLVKAGHSDLFVGTYESEWLDVKRAPYGHTKLEQLELAKDVASFANASGGLLLIGLKTKRDTNGDRIVQVNGCSLTDRAADWTDPVCRSTTSESVVDMTGGKLAFSVDRTVELGAVTVVA